eukprot:scaffold144333_cov48-Prasinocladus_malaysianus.AAC.1
MAMPVLLAGRGAHPSVCPRVITLGSELLRAAAVAHQQRWTSTRNHSSADVCSHTSSARTFTGTKGRGSGETLP